MTINEELERQSEKRLKFQILQLVYRHGRERAAILTDIQVIYDFIVGNIKIDTANNNQLFRKINNC